MNPYLLHRGSRGKGAAAPFPCTPNPRRPGPPLRSGQILLDHSEHLLHNHHASVASLRLLFTFAPERRSASLRKRCSPSPESPLFTFMPLRVQALIVFTSWIIVFIENLTFPKNRSIASILCAIAGAFCLFCGIAWRITGSEGWSRAGLVCGCLLAGLVFLDRRQEWFDL